MMTEPLPVLQRLNSQGNRLTTTMVYGLLKLHGYQKIWLDGLIQNADSASTAVTINVYGASGDMSTWDYRSSTPSNSKILPIGSALTTKVVTADATPANVVRFALDDIGERRYEYYIVTAQVTAGNTADLLLRAMGKDFVPIPTQ